MTTKDVMAEWIARLEVGVLPKLQRWAAGESTETETKEDLISELDNSIRVLVEDIKKEIEGE